MPFTKNDPRINRKGRPRKEKIILTSTEKNEKENELVV